MMSSDPFGDEVFVSRFNRRRLEEDSVNSCVDEPAIVERFRLLAPQNAVELGCGTGGLTSVLAHHCQSLSSVDRSPVMIDMARAQVSATNVQFICSSFESFVPSMSVDVAVSGMAMHLVADLHELCTSIYRWLKPGGTFIFSQRHPLRTANPLGADVSTEKPSWKVSNYFDVGERTYNWLGYDVRYYHRTLAEIVASVVGAGFEIREIVEPQPVNHHHTDRGVENRSSPAVLLLICRKPDQRG